MHRVFHCGIGMVVVVAAQHAEQAAQLLSGAGETVYRIGEIVARRDGQPPTTVS
jgi:phosphoribosylformylglycinamidine cyclo-ligase